MNEFRTADLCDAHEVEVLEPVFSNYGAVTRFHGPVATARVFEDNVLVRAMLETPGEGRVLVVDGGGSMRCALLGDSLAQLACDNGWRGVVIYGCVRDSAELARIPIGICALATHPRKSGKRGEGKQEGVLRMAGVAIAPGQHLYADEDGVVIAQGSLA